MRGLGGDDGGNAVVEFTTLGVLLLIPTLYLLITLGRIQAAVFATEAGARGAARAVTVSDSEEAGLDAAAWLVEFALDDQGFEAEPGAMDVRCSAASCLEPGSDVTVTVAVTVPLPGVPSFGGWAGRGIEVSATHVAVVDDFRAAP